MTTVIATVVSKTTAKYRAIATVMTPVKRIGLGNWEPADVGLIGLEIYYDNTAGAPKVKFKAKDNVDAIFVGEIALTPV
jgi:hypothetical protein